MVFSDICGSTAKERSFLIMKKLLALILSLVMALGCLSLASAETTGL